MGTIWQRIKQHVFLNPPPPRVQLFFIATVIKTFCDIIYWLVSATHFQLLAACSSVVLLLWICLMLAMAIPQTDNLLIRTQRWLKPAYKISLVILVFAIGVQFLVVSTFMAWNTIDRDSLPPVAHGIIAPFTTPYDASALTMQAVENLLSGKNPYAHANVVDALKDFPDVYNMLTPLRTGAFADSSPYPDQETLKNFWHAAITNPDVIPPEIESRVNYPAGSFLLLAPFVALGISDMRIILIIFTIPAIIYAARRIHPHQRWYFILGILLSIEFLNTIFTINTKLLSLSFVMIGWLMASRRPWLSAILMGIAVATKQTAWFLLPFYIIFIWKTAGIRPAIRRGITIGTVFLIINAPFIIANPQLWLSSVLGPMIDPMFPLGHGFVSLVIAGIIPFDSSIFFALLEITAFAGCILWYIRYASRYPHAGLILAVIPLYFAWRSLSSYFFFVDVMLLSTILIQEKQRLRISETQT